ncbi:hypothetical protein MVEG_08482 [Podila verticillata NRRL 6337]|nr:hypothetical protein MVEG_08482 [Podila verticillata NRRL 6337]
MRSAIGRLFTGSTSKSGAVVVAHPNVARPHSSDNLWLLCFQRAYSQSIRVNCLASRITTSGYRFFEARHIGEGSISCSRQYSSSTTSVRLNLKQIDSTSTQESRLHRHSRVMYSSPNKAPQPIRTDPLIQQLERALTDHDLKEAWKFYLRLRRRTFASYPFHTWLRIQNKLIQLIYRTKFQWRDSNQAARLVDKIQQLDVNRSILLKDMANRTLKNDSPELAPLIDALACSKAIIHHAYAQQSTAKLDDWRRALSVMQDWVKERAGQKLVSALQIQDPELIAKAATSRKKAYIERVLSNWLERILDRLVYSHTYLVRSTVANVPALFGISATVGMYLTLLKYYALQGKDGYRDTLELVAAMDTNNIQWKTEPVVYDHFLRALSHMSGNETTVDKTIQQMIDNDLVPREQTMVAAIMCAARSGDLEVCSRYVARMHQEWGLSLTERMKAILLYACAKRGDFETAFDILIQLSRSEFIVHREHLKSSTPGKGVLRQKRGFRQQKHQKDTKISAGRASLEDALLDQETINATNFLLALINETHAKRAGRRNLSQEFVKEEVSKVLELFAIITANPDRVDSQLYTIMMQYLSTLPSPLPGMMYLYKEMVSSDRARPNGVTYRIMLEACAEQMDMDIGQVLWSDMVKKGILLDCHVRASYVKGWGRVGNIKWAEKLCKEGLAAQRKADHNQEKAPGSVTKIVATPRATDMINLTVLHELMRANRTSNIPGRVIELYQEIDRGQWGHMIRPNQITLSIVLQACGSPSASTVMVDQGIKLVEKFTATHRGLKEAAEINPQNHVDDLTRAIGTLSGNSQAFSGEVSPPRLSEINYQLYFTMLGRHHRQRKMLEAWEDMIQQALPATGPRSPPSRLTVSTVIESLENVQWGAGPIKRIQKDLEMRWPQIDWTGKSRKYGRHGASVVVYARDGSSADDETTGAGGRFWRS